MSQIFDHDVSRPMKKYCHKEKKCPQSIKTVILCIKYNECVVDATSSPCKAETFWIPKTKETLDLALSGFNQFVMFKFYLTGLTAF